VYYHSLLDGRGWSAKLVRLSVRPSKVLLTTGV